MELEKIRNLGDNELTVEANKTAEQLFRLRFQLKLGQTDVVKKVRGLRKDIARFKTIARERELGLHGAQHLADSTAPKRAAGKSHVSKARRGAPAPAKKTAAKKAVKKSKTTKEAR